MPAVTGHKCKLYRNTGTNASPTWVLITGVGDVSIADLSYGAAELKHRGSNFAKQLPTLIQPINVDVQLIHGIDATNYTAIRTAFFAATINEYAIADGLIATVDTQAFKFPAFWSDFPWNQPLEEVSNHDARLSLAYMEEAAAEVDPEWMVVSA
jgi:hypothetical protein